MLSTWIQDAVDADWVWLAATDRDTDAERPRPLIGRSTCWWIGVFGDRRRTTGAGERGRRLGEGEGAGLDMQRAKGEISGFVRQSAHAGAFGWAPYGGKLGAPDSNSSQVRFVLPVGRLSCNFFSCREEIWSLLFAGDFFLVSPQIHTYRYIKCKLHLL